MTRRGARDRRAEGRDPGLRERRLAVRAVRGGGGRDGDRGLRLERRHPRRVGARRRRRSLAHKRAGGTRRRLRRRRGDRERRAARAAVRRARALRARARRSTEANADRGAGADRGRGRERPDDAGGRRDPRGGTACSSSPTCSRTRAGSSSRYFEWVQGLQELFWTEAGGERAAPQDRLAAPTRDLGAARAARHLAAARRLRPRRAAGRRGEPRSGGSIPSTVTLVVARDCHLCERARDELARLAGELGFEVAEVDITGDPGARAPLPALVPVIEVGGEQVSVYRVDRGGAASQTRCFLSASL